jgi:hypothetical protein
MGLPRVFRNLTTGTFAAEENASVTGTLNVTGNTTLSTAKVTGTLTLTKTTDAEGAVNNGPALIVGGEVTAAHIEVDNNEVMAKSNATTATTLYLNANGGTVYVGKTVSVTEAGTIDSGRVAAGSARDLLIARMADNDLFRIRVGGDSDLGYAEIATADNGNDPIYVRQYNDNDQTFGTTIARTLTLLDANGNTYIPGTVSMRDSQTRSDITTKENLEQVHAGDLSSLLAFKYNFIDDDSKTKHVGLISQHVKAICPEAVSLSPDGILNLDYNAVVALLVDKVNQQDRELKRLNEEIENIKQLLNK